MFLIASLTRAGRLPWAVLAAAFWIAAAFPTPSAAHEGHDHGAPPPAPLTAAAPRLEAVSETFELVAIAQDGALAIYLDGFTDNAPVAGAAIEVTGDGGAGKAVETEPGGYSLPAEWTKRPGSYNLVFSVAAGGNADLLIGTLDIPGAASQGSAAPERNGVAGRLAAAGWDRIGSIAALLGLGGVILLGRGRMRAIAVLLMMTVVGVMLARASFAHEGEDHSRDQKTAPDNPSGPAAQPDGSVFVPKPMQRLLEVRTVLAKPAEAGRTIELPGQVIPDPNSIGRVQSARSGRLEPPKEGFPVLGQRVSAGQILAYLDPTMDLIDRLDIEERMRALDQQARLAQTQLERYSKLSGVIPQRQIDEARIEFEGLQRRRRIIEPLLGQKDALRAPIDGVIARANAVAGQVVQGQDVLFEIIDPVRLWVEASAFDASALGNLEAATAATADGRKLDLRFMGRGYALKQQAVPLQFRIEQPPQGLTAGMPVTVFIQSDQRLEGIRVPAASVVRGAGGQEFVWTHPSAERFQQKAVRIQPLDGASVLITAGIDPGSRVVTAGAELLNQIR